MARTPAWQRNEGKNPAGGLNAAGRASLRAAGQNCDRFNMTDNLARKFDSGTGPLQEVLL